MPMQKEMRSEWVKAGYERGMGSAEVVPPPHADFIRVYHLTSTEYAISNIALSRLKVARFAELNDPFELLAANCMDAPVRKAAQSHKKAFNTRFGVLCFCANWTNPVMWSHYGARHTGIALGFDLRRSRAQPVRYEEKRLSLDEAKPGELSSHVKDLLVVTKFKHWEYEQEQRVIINLKDCRAEGARHFKSFNNDLRLAEVILGPLCDIELDEMRALVRIKDPHVKVYKSRPAFGGFTIVPKESTVDW